MPDLGTGRKGLVRKGAIRIHPPALLLIVMTRAMQDLGSEKAMAQVLDRLLAVHTVDRSVDLPGKHNLRKGFTHAVLNKTIASLPAIWSSTHHHADCLRRLYACRLFFCQACAAASGAHPSVQNAHIGADHILLPNDLAYRLTLRAAPSIGAACFSHVASTPPPADAAVPGRGSGVCARAKRTGKPITKAPVGSDGGLGVSATPVAPSAANRSTG